MKHQAFVLALKDGAWNANKGPNLKLERLKESLSIDKSRLSLGNELRNNQKSVLSTSSQNQALQSALKLTNKKSFIGGDVSNRSMSRDKSPFTNACSPSNLMKWQKSTASYQDFKQDMNAFRSVQNFR